MTEQGNIATELDAAGVPHDAMRRLAELQPGRAGSIFTSDLSVNEFLLVREAGFRPLGLVLGSSIYHVGLQIGQAAHGIVRDARGIQLGRYVPLLGHALS